MAIKNKKVIAWLLAAAMIAAAPNTISLAAQIEDGAEAENAADDANEGGAQANGETVLDDGEVVMEGAIGKVDESEWITLEDYELVAESNTGDRWYGQYLSGRSDHL